jgi:hypothetical protein
MRSRKRSWLKQVFLLYLTSESVKAGGGESHHQPTSLFFSAKNARAGLRPRTTLPLASQLSNESAPAASLSRFYLGTNGSRQAHK